MSAWIMPPVAGFIDQGTAPEFYIDGIGAIEMLNGNVRIYLISEQSRVEDRKEPAHRLVTAKLIGPLLNVPQAIGQLAGCLWTREPQPWRGQTPHLVP